LQKRTLLGHLHIVEKMTFDRLNKSLEIIRQFRIFWSVRFEAVSVYRFCKIFPFSLFRIFWQFNETALLLYYIYYIYIYNIYLYIYRKKRMDTYIYETYTPSKKIFLKRFLNSFFINFFHKGVYLPEKSVHLSVITFTRIYSTKILKKCGHFICPLKISVRPMCHNHPPLYLNCV
jgi:hypothetical protein